MNLKEDSKDTPSIELKRTTIYWPDITFPPINLYSAPKINSHYKEDYSNDSGNGYKGFIFAR